MAVTAANKAAVLNYVRDNNVPLPTKNGAVDTGSKQVKQLADQLGLSKDAVAEALTGYQPPQAQLGGGKWSPTGGKGEVARKTFEAADPAGADIDVKTYQQIGDAFKDLSKDSRKAELKWVEGKGQFGLEKYLK